MKKLYVFLTIIVIALGNMSFAISTNKISSSVNTFFNNYLILAIPIIILLIFISLHLIVHIFVGLDKLSNKFGCITDLAILSLFIAGNIFSIYFLISLSIIALIADIVIKNDRIINEKIKKREVGYYRDIPCNKDIFKIYYIAYQYCILEKRSDFLGAIILKWIKEKRVVIASNNSIHKKGSIIFNNEFDSQNWDNIREKELYQMMYIASKNGILEKNELKKWCNNRFNKIHKWFKDVMSDEFSKLIDTKELDVDIKTAECKASEKLLEQAKQIYGLKKFLNDFTPIHNRENLEVHLFEEYLIIAQILGVSNKTIKQFQEIYPDIIKNVSIDFRDYMKEHFWYIN